MADNKKPIPQRDMGIFDIEDLFGSMPRAKQGSSVPSFEAKGLYIDEDEAMSANQGGDMLTKTDKDVLVNKGIAVSADEVDAGPSKKTPIEERVTVKPIPIEYGPDGPPMRRRGWSCDEAVTMDTNQVFTPTEEAETGPITCVKKAILDLRKAHSFMNNHFGRRNWRIKDAPDAYELVTPRPLDLNEVLEMVRDDKIIEFLGYALK